MKFDSLHLWLGEGDGLLRSLENQRRIRAFSPAEMERLQIRADAGNITGDDPFDGYGYMVSMLNDIAIVKIQGDLVPFDHPYNQFWGEVSYEEIRNALIASVDAGAKGAMLDFATHGGDANGIKELSDFISELDKSGFPVYTYTGTNMLSGGYWLGSVGREVIANEMAWVGSIGVISVHMSQKDMLDKLGITATVFRAGEFKALGTPFENLDAKATKDIQSRLTGIYDIFLSHVGANRDMSVELLKEHAAEGRVFLGADAERVGLVDRVLSFDKALALVSEKMAGQSRTTLTFNPPDNRSTLSMKRVLNAKGEAAVASGVDLKIALKNADLTTEVNEQTAEEIQAETEAAAAAQAELDAKAEKEKLDAKAAADLAANPTANTGLMELVTKVTDLSGQLAVAKAENAQLTEKLAATTATESALMKIAASSINNMQIGLGARPLNLEGMNAEAVVKAYHATSSDFHSKMKSGARAEVAVEQDLGGGSADGGYRPTAAVSIGAKK